MWAHRIRKSAIYLHVGPTPVYMGIHHERILSLSLSALTHPPFFSFFGHEYCFSWLLRFFTRVLLQSTLFVERSVCTFVVGSYHWGKGEWISFIFVTPKERERESRKSLVFSIYIYIRVNRFFGMRSLHSKLVYSKSLVIPARVRVWRK